MAVPSGELLIACYLLKERHHRYSKDRCHVRRIDCLYSNECGSKWYLAKQRRTVYNVALWGTDRNSLATRLNSSPFSSGEIWLLQFWRFARARAVRRLVSKRLASILRRQSKLTVML